MDHGSDARFQVLKAGAPTPCEADNAGAVYHRGVGERDRLEGAERGLGGVQPDREGQPLLAEELSHDFAGFADVHGHHHQTLVRMGLVEGLKVGHLGPAWRAPACPSVQEHDLAAKVVQGCIQPIEIR